MRPGARVLYRRHQLLGRRRQLERTNSQCRPGGKQGTAGRSSEPRDDIRVWELPAALLWALGHWVMGTEAYLGKLEHGAPDATL